MHFSIHMKMADLVERDFHLLGLLSRFGIEQRFGDRSVADICTESGIDPETLAMTRMADRACNKASGIRRLPDPR